MQTDITKLGGLELKEDRNILLYSVSGRVLPVRGFAEQHLGLLNGLEQRLVMEHSRELSDEALPLASPFVRTRKYFDGRQKLEATRAGARSAYIRDLGLKIKGCRPEDGVFPEWDVDGSFNVIVNEIPFGVLTAESAMREILAYCFMRRHGLPCSSEPVGVFEYCLDRDNSTYGLVSRIPEDERAEQFIDCGNYSLHDVIRLKRAGKLCGHEAGLCGFDMDEYIRAKCDLLAAFNFNGGFRGILNSNIGNDVVRGGRLHSLCDFDTFRVDEAPKDGVSLRKFVGHAFMELIKTSLPFVAYLELGDDVRAVHASLAGYYRQHSRLYKSYLNRFLEHSASQKWGVGFVEGCINETFKTNASFEILQELIPNRCHEKNRLIN